MLVVEASDPEVVEAPNGYYQCIAFVALFIVVYKGIISASQVVQRRKMEFFRASPTNSPRSRSRFLPRSRSRSGNRRGAVGYGYGFGGYGTAETSAVGWLCLSLLLPFFVL